jgi:hypothetical protein
METLPMGECLYLVRVVLCPSGNRLLACRYVVDGNSENAEDQHKTLCVDT